MILLTSNDFRLCMLFALSQELIVFFGQLGAFQQVWAALERAAQGLLSPPATDILVVAAEQDLGDGYPPPQGRPVLVRVL